VVIIPWGIELDDDEVVLADSTEKFEWSKVSTNSIDSESSTSILVRDDVKRHTANTSKKIETLDAILAIQSLCLWFCMCVYEFGGFLCCLRVERERDMAFTSK
jgi:hypothetical protein